ncbi:tetratricopeptide repeat protein [Flavobacteriaceae bacterium LSUCC0859]|nr:tetratricopeptide repeat protein [Flavobacteriaceae bacterium LSUCC0859]
MKKKRRYNMKMFFTIVYLCASAAVLAQESALQTNERPSETQRSSVDPKKAIDAQNLTYWANESVAKDHFVKAETQYRKAIGTDPNNPIPAFNLGSTFYNNESYSEALSPLKKAATVVEDEAQKHAIFHNMGNVFMKSKAYEKAVEAYKEALRNDPTDHETRYNLALAKEMLKKEQQEKDQEQKDQNQKDDSKKDQDQDQKDKQDQEGDQKKDQEGNPDQGEGDKKDENGDPKDPGEQEKEEQKKGEGDRKKETEQKPKEKEESQAPPRKSQLSPQQIQNLLEAMQNAEKKSQEKLDAKKVKGVPVKTKKDW